MLNTWERAGVDEVIERVEGGGGDGRAKLRRLSSIAGSNGAALRIDLAVRDWSRRDKRVAKRLTRVDNRRMDYLRSLFGAFCPDENEVEVRCMLFYSLWIGSPSSPPITASQPLQVVLALGSSKRLDPLS